MRVAIVHDWILGLRGGERVLDALCELYPRATVHSLFHSKGSTTARIDGMDIKTSILNRIPGSRRVHRYLLPFYPWAIGHFRLQPYDLVISCSHAVALGAPVILPTPHLCYCLTPMRYVWDMFPAYQLGGSVPRPARWGLRFFRRALQIWDRKCAQKVNAFAAISQFVADRIDRCYSRRCEIIYPPVNTAYFRHVESSLGQKEFYLLVSAFVPYKRIELVLAAFDTMRIPLWIVGSGPLESRLRSLAGPWIRFLGRVSDEELRQLYSAARALVYAAEEEFGIVPVEAQACGTPVIAYGKGGLAETVVDEETGILYQTQDTGALVDAVERSRSHRFDRHIVRQHAEKFSRERFLAQFEDFVQLHAFSSCSKS